MSERELESWQLQALKEEACELDINHGGYCDVRSGAINFWGGPDDCPEGQGDMKYFAGALNHPRNFIGTVTLSDLSVSSTNYAKMREDHGPTLIYREDREPYTDQPEDIAWVKKQWAELWKAALPGTPVPRLAEGNRE